MHIEIQLININKAQIICGYLYLEFNVHSCKANDLLLFLEVRFLIGGHFKCALS